MAARRNVSISLSPELHAVAERILASGRYGNFSDVVRAGLRLLDERELRFDEHGEEQRRKGGESKAAVA